jgi:hypothetical protein
MSYIQNAAITIRGLKCPFYKYDSKYQITISIFVSLFVVNNLQLNMSYIQRHICNNYNRGLGNVLPINAN